MFRLTPPVAFFGQPHVLNRTEMRKGMDEQTRRFGSPRVKMFHFPVENAKLRGVARGSMAR